VGVLSAGLGFLMIAVLLPGSAMGSAICLAGAGVATILSIKFEYWTVIAAGFGAAAIGLGTQGAVQTAIAGIVVVVAVITRFSPVVPDMQRILVALGIGSVLGVLAALLPINAGWLVLASPVLIVLLFAAVLGPVLEIESSDAKK
jgi:hypothetical protein